MADFKKRGGFGGGKSFGRRDFGGSGDSRGGSSFGGGASRSRFNRPGNRDFRQTQMFSATCAECAKPCEVPFRPNGDKPVYCSYCFNKNKPAGTDSRSSGEYPRRDSGSSFDRAPRKEYSSSSFSSNSSSAPVARAQVDNGQINEIKRQIDTLNTKIDKLMELISKGSSSVQKFEKKTEEKTLEKSPEKKAEEINTAVKSAVNSNTATAKVTEVKKIDKKADKKAVKKVASKKSK